MAGGEGARILFLIAQFPPIIGGAETQADHLSRALAAAGRPVDVLTCAVPGAPSVETRGGVTVHRAIRVIRAHGLWGASHWLGTAAFLARHGRRYGAFVGFGLPAFHNPAVIAWARRRGLATVVRCECSGEFGDLAILGGMASGTWIASSLRGAGAIVALTGEMRAELEEAGFAAEQIVVVPNGVDLDAFRPPGPGEPRGRGLVFAGRLAPQKGLPDLIAAFGALAPEFPDVTLHLYGEGPERPLLERLAAERGLRGRVAFHGLIPPGEVRAAVARAAAVVHPSLGEGLSCGLLEAMAAGCPIVATDIPPNREAIVDRESGLLTPPRDPAALAAAIGRVLREPGLGERLGAGAHRRATERFSLGAVAARYIEVIDATAGARRC